MSNKAAGTEKRIGLSGGDVEAETVHGRVGAVALSQFVDVD